MERGDRPVDCVERRILVEAGQLKLFATAIGETDPIYFDDAAARAAGLRAALAPPTFAYALGSLAFGVASWHQLGIDASRLLHGEQRFDHLKPIYAGDELTLRRSVADRYDKKGGLLSFVVVETDIFDSSDQLCVRSRTVGVIQNA